jgi:predicted transcriptional regulator
LEQEFIAQRVGGFPVIAQGRLVGIVSRSDVVRQLTVEHAVAAATSDFYRDETGFHEVPVETLEQLADRVGERIEQLCVRDVMSRQLFKVAPDQPLRFVAQTMVDNHIHRVLVTDDDRLLGLVTALDLVRLVATGRLKPA